MLRARRDRMRVHEIERNAPPGEVIVDAAHHRGRAMALAARAQLVRGHPQCADDAVVERVACDRLAGRAAEREAQVGRAGGAGAVVVREIDADERVGRERVRGFLERFSDHGVGQRFAGFEMACRLVDAQARRGFFLDHEKAAGVLDERGDRHMRGPDFGFHGSAFYRLLPNAAGHLAKRIRPSQFVCPADARRRWPGWRAIRRAHAELLVRPSLSPKVEGECRRS